MPGKSCSASSRRACVVGETRIWPPWPTAQMRAARLTARPRYRPAAIAASPVWMPMRTRSSTPSGQSAPASARWPCSAARIASFGFRKTKNEASPCVPTACPPAFSAASRRSRSCCERTSAKPSFRRRSNAVEPSTSLKRKVTVPVGSSTPGGFNLTRASPVRLLDGEPRAQGVTALEARARVELAAVHGHALAHPDEPVPTAVAVASAAAVVADGDLDVPVAVADEHLGVLGLGVLDRVRQAFLDEAVRGEIEARGELHGLALDAELDGKPGLARARDELVDVVEARLRRERRRLLGPPENADEAAHLRERLAPGLLHDEQGLALPLLLGKEEAPRSGGLHGHDADAVADHVVELARDPRALLGDRHARVLLACAFEPIGSLRRLGDLLAPRRQEVPGGPHGGEQDERPDEVSGPLVRQLGRDEHDNRDRDPQARERLATLRDRSERENSAQRAEEGEAQAVVALRVDPDGAGNRDERERRRPDRKAAPQEQRQRPEGREGCRGQLLDVSVRDRDLDFGADREGDVDEVAEPLAQDPECPVHAFTVAPASGDRLGREDESRLLLRDERLRDQP